MLKPSRYVGRCLVLLSKPHTRPMATRLPKERVKPMQSLRCIAAGVRHADR